MSDFASLHRMVWTFRNAVNEWWATPSPVECLLYAYTEAGEAIDAWLREQRPGDARNNERDRDVLHELADTAIMLLSAFPEGSVPERVPLQSPASLANIAYCVGEALLFLESGSVQLARESAAEALQGIRDWPGIDLEWEINGRLQRIFDKAGVPPEKAWDAFSLAERFNRWGRSNGFSERPENSPTA